MMSRVKEQLEQMCQKINHDGFYVGLSCASDVICPNEFSKHIKSEVAANKCNAFLHSPFEVVNPLSALTTLYKVDAGLFRAFPVHHDSAAFNRFFMPTCSSHNLSGVVIVSHKLKMLSFLLACYSLSSQDDHIALWFCSELTDDWVELADVDPMASVSFFPNKLHANYSDVLVFRKFTGVNAWEVCLSIEDHWKNEVLRNEICMMHDVKLLNSDIKSAKAIISSQEDKIAEFEERIKQSQDSHEKYKLDIFKSRVDADLLNASC